MDRHERNDNDGWGWGTFADGSARPSPSEADPEPDPGFCNPGKAKRHHEWQERENARKRGQ
jgi:hypothetical protein